MRVKRLNVEQLKEQINKKNKDIGIWVILSSIGLIIAITLFMFEISFKWGFIIFFWDIILWVLTSGYILDQKLDQIKVEVMEYGNGRNKAR